MTAPTAETRYYHASPTLFSPGDVLLPGAATGCGYYKSSVVCMCNSQDPHSSIRHHALAEKWYVYEVNPKAGWEYPAERASGEIGFVVGPYFASDDEVWADHAVVLSLLGRYEGGEVMPL